MGFIAFVTEAHGDVLHRDTIRDKHNEVYRIEKRHRDTGEPSGIDKSYHVIHHRHGEVAHAIGTMSRERPVVDHVEVSKRFRRRGIATAMYRHIESHEGITLKNNAITRSGKAFRSRFSND